jgi:DNA-binding NarL/FixJ family response regulator
MWTGGDVLDGHVTNIEARSSLVLIVDDHPLFRMGLAELLRIEPTMRVAAAVGTPKEAIEIATAQPLDLALIDVLLPSMSGIALTKEIKRIRPECKVLGLSALDEPLRIAEMLRAGADGFTTKAQPSEQIIEAMNQVLNAHRYLAPNLDATEINTLTRSDTTWPLERLTVREREVFDLLVRGSSNDEIATQLSISRRTVETHRQNLMRKLNARSMVDLVRLAVRYES